MPCGASAKPPLLALLLAALCSVLAMAPEAIATHLAFDRTALQAGEFWRLWTGHLVHFSSQHAALDIAVFFLLSMIAEQEAGTAKVAKLLFSAALPISLCLLILVPELQVYRGLSGLSAMLATMAGISIWQRAPRWRSLITLFGLAIVGKILLDACGVLPSSLPDGIRIAWQAHLAGMAMAALLVPA